MFQKDISRRSFLKNSALAAAGSRLWLPSLPSVAQSSPLEEFGYSDVELASELHERQFRESQAVLLSLNEDSLLKPLRQMAGMPAPGSELGGWYSYKRDFDYRSENWDGFAPACTFGQWISALARGYAITRSEETRKRVLRLNQLYAKTIPPDQ